MKSIKINGKKVSIPTNWGEVKFYEAIRMFDESMNNIDVFSMFTGYPVYGFDNIVRLPIYYERMEINHACS